MLGPLRSASLLNPTFLAARFAVIRERVEKDVGAFGKKKTKLQSRSIATDQPRPCLGLIRSTHKPACWIKTLKKMGSSPKKIHHLDSPKSRMALGDKGDN